MDAEAPAPRPLRDAGARTTTGWTTPTPQLKQRRRRVRTAFRTVGRCARYNVGRTQVLQEQKRRVRHVSAPRNTDGTMSPRALRFPGACSHAGVPLTMTDPTRAPTALAAPPNARPSVPRALTSAVLDGRRGHGCAAGEEPAARARSCISRASLASHLLCPVTCPGSSATPQPAGTLRISREATCDFRKPLQGVRVCQEKTYPRTGDK